jgi:hypothetical protein
MAIISVGENAPDFVLKDHNNTEPSHGLVYALNRCNH